MQLDDFDFELPEELIAQYPDPVRDGARLMTLQRSTQTISTGRVPDLLNYLTAGDVLVINNTRVRPARLLGQKDTGGQVEALLVDRQAGDEEIWACLTRASKALRPGQQISFPHGITGEVIGDAAETQKLIRFHCQGSFEQALEVAGHMPLPPYIRRREEALDRERYQTVYAAEPGAVAAPTAGLHFSQELLAALRAQGVIVAPLTLHVGIGTFAPIRHIDLAAHRMHSEVYTIPEETAAAVQHAKEAGRRVVAVGTTSTRALESAADQDGRLTRLSGVTSIFIKPGDRFRVVDALMTNFHLPRTTLLVLVAAFAGRDFVLEAYRRAVAERFRFFSYGDSMFIL